MIDRRRVLKLIPRRLRAPITRAYLSRSRSRNKELSATEVFSEIYSSGSWGESETGFCSGPGSAGSVTNPYVELIEDLVNDHDVRRIVDVGCGDFRVGSRLNFDGVSYLGIDVVPELVAFNADQFGEDDVEFLCLDISKDVPPPGDLCLVRQVFQHLSNDQISSALANLAGFPLVVVTEHVPPASCWHTANVDKPHGHDIRAFDGSAVILDAPPFSVDGVLEVLSVEIPPSECVIAEGEILKSYLIDQRTPRPAVP